MTQIQINTYATIPASREVFPFRHVGEGNYIVKQAINENEIILAAKNILEGRFKRGIEIKKSEDARQYFMMKLGSYEYEVFCVAFLDNRHRLIADEILFIGSLNGSVVSPREVIRRVLHYNAAAVLFSHNHPSGDTNPSQADMKLTKLLKNTLDLFDVRVLDHIIVGGSSAFSFAERGML